MARGGFRPGAGRPKGARSKKETAALPPDIKKAAKRAKMSPLDYMLAVMNDEDADSGRRDRMAVAAAPYVHPRAADKQPGKKERAERAAQSAGQGTDWGDDLAPPPATIN